jgi:hypothetical protein
VHERHGLFSGDRLEPYLILGDGPERSIDEYVASDAAGRYLVVVVNDHLLLIDTMTGREEDLSQHGANAMDVNYAIGSHRSASFDRGGQRLLYLRKTPRGDIPVVRTLATGREVELDPGDGLVWRAKLSPEGHWVELDMITKDTNGDGKLTLPSLVTTMARRRCRGPVGSYSIRGLDGDQPILRLVSAAGGKARKVDNLVQPWGEQLLKRTSEGALILGSDSGQSQELVPASCNGTVLHADIARNRILVQCQGSENMALYGQGLHIDFAEEPPPEWDNSTRNQVLRLLKCPHAVVDLARGLVHRTKDAWQVAQYQGRALLVRDNRLLLYDADKDTEVDIAALDNDSRPIDHTGAMALLRIGAPLQSGVFGLPAVKTAGEALRNLFGVDDRGVRVGSSLVFDLAAGKIVGQALPSALAVADDGKVLVSRSAPRDDHTGEGPLLWMKAVPLQ